MSSSLISLSRIFGCFNVSLTAAITWICHCVHRTHETTNRKKWTVQTQGGDCDSWRGGWGWAGEAVVKLAGAAWPLSRCRHRAGLDRAGSLSKYLHANWCYLIHLSVKRFHHFKNWKGGGSLVALSWQFDSDCIIRACFYNKQELSCTIRHARRHRPLSPLHPTPC